MSTDFHIACWNCEVVTHLGQRMANKWSFGFGSLDETGRRKVWAFIEQHLGCGSGPGDLCIYNADATPDWLKPVDLDSLEPIGD